ncbi:FAS1 domain-containing protein [Aspergillus recurvatus]
MRLLTIPPIHFLALLPFLIHPTLSQNSTARPLSEAAPEHGGGLWGAEIADSLPPNTRGGNTLFIPHDNSFPRRVRAIRQAGDSEGNSTAAAPGRQQLLYQVSEQLLSEETLRAFTGSVIETLDTDAGLGGDGQVVLTHGLRDAADRGSNSSQGCVNEALPVRIYGGQGESVEILEANIPFDGGIFHIVSGPFTRPASLSSSLRSTSEASIFTTHIASHFSALDSSPSITVFVPANNALSVISSLNSEATLSDSEISALVDAHLVSGVAAYSPHLITGARYQTQDGGEVVVTAESSGGIVLNEEVRVIQSDIVVGNGVVHLIDRPLYTPGDSSPTGTGTATVAPTATATLSGGGTVFTGAAGWSSTRACQTAHLSWRIMLGLALIAPGGFRF